MASTTDRQAARERLRQLFEATLDQAIPADESQPLRGGKFVDWEDQSERFAEALCPAFVEERSALEETALVEGAGRCPHCASEDALASSTTTTRWDICMTRRRRDGARMNRSVNRGPKN